MQNCYGKGNRKIPKDILDGQDERLTAKHIQTLAFVQDIVKENKDLKAKVKDFEEHFNHCGEMHVLAEESKNRIIDIQDNYMKRADEIRKELTDKHTEELMQKVQDNLQAEKTWAEEKEQLLSQLASQKSEIAQLKAQVTVQQQGTKSTDGLVQELQRRIVVLETELATLRADSAKLEEAKANQLAEIERLRHLEVHNVDLLAEVKEVNQVNKELQFRISKLEREMGESGLKDTTEIMATLKNRLTKLHKEKSLWEEKEKEYIRQVEELKEEISKLRHALADSERMRDGLGKQLQELLQDLEQMRRHSSMERDKQTFKDFIQLKRELQIVRQENDELKTRLKLATGGKGRVQAAILPSVREAGNSAEKGRRKSAFADIAATRR